MKSDSKEYDLLEFTGCFYGLIPLHLCPRAKTMA